jgi:hypothetical protein
MEAPILLEPNKIYGLSNGSLNEWDKVIRGKQLFEEVCTEAEEAVGL